MVESQETADELLVQPAITQSIALLVIGDPVSATTHVDVMLRAKAVGASVEIIHNASILTACGSCGLQLYHFGQTVSLPFWDTAQRTTLRHHNNHNTSSSSSSSSSPITSWYSKIQYNRRGGLHTLCLLDIQVKEPDYPLLAQTGKMKYLPPRFMTVSTAAQQLIIAAELYQQQEQQQEQPLGDQEDGATTDNIPAAAAYHPKHTLCVGLARLGQRQPTTATITTTTNQSYAQCIIAGTLSELAQVSTDTLLGPPLHSLILCGTLHDLEVQALQEYLLPNTKFTWQQHEQHLQSIMKQK